MSQGRPHTPASKLSGTCSNGRHATARKRAQALCSPSNGASQTIAWPTSSIGRLIALRPPDQRSRDALPVGCLVDWRICFAFVLEFHESLGKDIVEPPEDEMQNDSPTLVVTADKSTTRTAPTPNQSSMPRGNTPCQRKRKHIKSTGWQSAFMTTPVSPWI